MATIWEKFLYKRSGEVLRAADKTMEAVQRVTTATPVQISRRSYRLPEVFHGIPTLHTGDEISREEFKHLDAAMANMKQKYPDAHKSISQFFLKGANTHPGDIPDYFASGEAQIGDGVAGINSGDIFPLSGDGWQFSNRMGIDVETAHVPDDPGWSHLAPENNVIGPDILGRTYTHEFMHAVHFHTAAVLTGESNFLYDQNPVVKRFHSKTEELAGKWNQHFINATSNSPRPGGFGITGNYAETHEAPELRLYNQEELARINAGNPDPSAHWDNQDQIIQHKRAMQNHDRLKRENQSQYISPAFTGHILGSQYAGTDSIELLPELNVMRHYGDRRYTPQLEAAMRKVDANIMSANQANQTIRHGARPKSRSAMGGIAYLQ